jgi:hypothetical protein
MILSTSLHTHGHHFGQPGRKPLRSPSVGVGWAVTSPHATPHPWAIKASFDTSTSYPAQITPAPPKSTRSCVDFAQISVWASRPNRRHAVTAIVTMAPRQPNRKGEPPSPDPAELAGRTHMSAVRKGEREGVRGCCIKPPNIPLPTFPRMKPGVARGK